MAERGDEAVTGLVLAGGLGRRMGGVDKGLRLFRGLPLAAHAIARLAPQVDALIINANQNRAAYEALGHPVIGDALGNFAGPLAGLHAGLCACATPLLVTVPCDSPLLPLDLVARLRAALQGTDAQLAVAQAGGWIQPVFALCRTDLRDELSSYLASGGRKVDAWFATLRVVEVPFDDEAAFVNINTPEELERLEPR
ncbi:molybdenum cofactor guanylyltransferase [mine drainage metagenome]|uniref:Molybdenum cofactor guanylyltransferase n=1 Tax=mine drainage metagenome TaxID=410659 RepID=A0A1J5RU56_9ZZZZ